MRGRDAELRARGARIVFVGTGLPAVAAGFAREHAGGHPVLSDPARHAFAAAGLRRSRCAFLHWRLLRNLARALGRGFRQSAVQGDPWQLGGVLVFASTGMLLHRQAERVAGDELDWDAVVAATAAAAPRR